VPALFRLAFPLFPQREGKALQTEIIQVQCKSWPSHAQVIVCLPNEEQEQEAVAMPMPGARQSAGETEDKLTGRQTLGRVEEGLCPEKVFNRIGQTKFWALTGFWVCYLPTNLVSLKKRRVKINYPKCVI